MVTTRPHASVNPPAARVDFLDATRAFALVLGVIFHASLSFLPFFIGWAVMDVSTSSVVGAFVAVSHSFRMELFFLLAGFFSCAVIQRKGTAPFLRNRILRLCVPFVVGWFILRPLIVSGWVMGAASLRGDYDVWAGLKVGFQSLGTLPANLFVGTHLWFLYYLALVTTLTLLGLALLNRLGRQGERLRGWARAAAAWIAESAWALPLLIGPTAGVLWLMRGWGMDTPDQSLMPHAPVLVIYSAFFVLGWLFDASAVARFGRLSRDRWLLATLGIAGTILLGSVGLDPSHPNPMPTRLAFCFAYAGMMWGLVSLTLGVFKALIRRSYPWIRYVADSSYWMYLIHLPIVVWLQVAMAEVALPWTVKLLVISGGTLALCLLTYDLFVRSTVIGEILNGSRRPRALQARRR